MHAGSNETLHIRSCNRFLEREGRSVGLPMAISLAACFACVCWLWGGVTLPTYAAAQPMQGRLARFAGTQNTGGKDNVGGSYLVSTEDVHTRFPHCLLCQLYPLLLNLFSEGPFKVYKESIASLFFPRGSFRATVIDLRWTQRKAVISCAKQFLHGFLILKESLGGAMHCKGFDFALSVLGAKEKGTVLGHGQEERLPFS